MTTHTQNTKHSSTNKKTYTKESESLSKILTQNHQPKKNFISEKAKTQIRFQYDEDPSSYKQTYPKQSYRNYSRDSDNYSTSNEDTPHPSSSSSSSNHFKPKASDFKIKYKTELCKNFEINGYCKFGDNCAYAHGKENLRSKISNTSVYRTKKCKQFFENGFCPYGNRCQFAHALRSNVINNNSNNPYDKNMSYMMIMNTLSKIENVEKIQTFNSNKKRLNIFETIIHSHKHNNNVNYTLFDDIKHLIKEEMGINN